MNLRKLICLALLVATSGVALADPPSLLRIFSRDDAKPLAGSKSYTLTEEDGPWLILASTFVGPNSKTRAEQLVDEIRSEFKLPAYTYQERFDFTGKLESRDPRGKSMRYANQYQYEAYAVLVGEYDTLEHRDLDSDLKKIRSANPAVFQRQGNDTGADPEAAPVSIVKSIKDKILRAKTETYGTRGPMGNAFVTRNPMLPEDYFDAPQVDSFVYQLNDDKEFSLLECDGKYTVIVRTFEGLETVVDGKAEKKFVPSLHRLDSYAEQADKMARKLRADGEDAFQFHDRFKSIVTVGSFDVLGRELPDGRFEYAPEIRQVMKKYSAFNAEVARSIPGSKGIAANHAAGIPFDVKPTPIAVPKPSKRSLYSAAFRR